MVTSLLIFVAIPTLLVAAALWDLTRYTIPNAISLALIAIFVVAAPLSGLATVPVAIHVGVGLAALIVGFTLFAFGFIGGGDAKLFAAVAVLMGPGMIMPYSLLAAIYGGVLTLSLLWLRHMALPPILARQAWIARLHEAGAGVPYGVALAVAAFATLPHTDFARLVSS